MLAPEEERPSTIDERSALDRRGLLSGLALDVTADPSLALGDEPGREAPSLGDAEAAAARDRDDDTAGRVDDDPDAMGPGRTAKGVRERPAGEFGDDRLLGGAGTRSGAQERFQVTTK